MGFFSNTYLDNRRREWMNSIVRFQYKVGASWFDAIINSRAIVNGKVQFYVHIPNVPATTHTVTGVRLIDTSGAVGGSQTVAITQRDVQGILTLFEFPIEEV